MQTSTARDKPAKTKFNKEPRYMHNRSEGLTHRRNSGSKYQTKETK